MWRIEIPDVPSSLNKSYAGRHWSKRKREADDWHWQFKLAFIQAKLPKPLAYPITIDVTEFTKWVVRDCDAAVMGAKYCGDALVQNGYLPDDSPEYVECVILRSKKSKENKIVILIH